MPLSELLREKIAEIVPQMKDEFTSHQIIERLARDNQKQYIEDLYQYRDNAAPFRTLHVEIAHAIKPHADKIGEDPSVTIFGDDSPCARWRRH